jgi:hypothetical protein
MNHKKITRKIRTHFELNKNNNKTHPNLCGLLKPSLGRTHDITFSFDSRGMRHNQCSISPSEKAK